MAKKSSIGQATSKQTMEEFANELSSHTTFKAKEIEELFPEETDRDELVKLINIVNLHTGNQAQLVNDINSVSGAVIKLVKKVLT